MIANQCHAGPNVYTVDDIDFEGNPIRRFHDGNPDQLSSQEIAELIFPLVAECVEIPVDYMTVRVISPYDAILSSPYRTFHTGLRYDSDQTLNRDVVESLFANINVNHELLIITAQDLTSKCLSTIENLDETHFIKVEEQLTHSVLDSRSN